jgi:hypothetical protein
MKNKHDYTEFKFKCLWRGTAVTYIVPGKSYADALNRVEKMLIRQMGGKECLEIKFMGEVE